MRYRIKKKTRVKWTFTYLCFAIYSNVKSNLKQLNMKSIACILKLKNTKNIEIVK